MKPICYINPHTYGGPNRPVITTYKVVTAGNEVVVKISTSQGWNVLQCDAAGNMHIMLYSEIVGVSF